MKKVKNPWRTLKSKRIYENPWIKIQEDKVIQPGGQKGIYSFLIKPPGAFVIAHEDDSIYFLKQFRYVIKKWIYELPAGVIVGKDNLANAKRELFEETGIKAKKWKLLGGYYCAPGHETTRDYAFLATNLDTSSIRIAQEGDESILSVEKIKISKLRKMLAAKKIECGISLAALSLFFNYLSLKKKI
jgi:8-oxo-dGTP pyrophosphatase MutT (NUDIX family)